MLMFFLNRPISLYPYLISFMAIFIWSFIVWPMSHNSGPFLALIVDIGSFSAWYYIFLIRYYILGGEEVIFFKIPLSLFKGMFNFYLAFYASLIIGVNFMMFKLDESFLLPFGLAWFGAVFCILFKEIVKAKFISEGIKHNSSIKGMNLDGIYQEFREVATRKLLIESEKNY